MSIGAKRYYQRAQHDGIRPPIALRVGLMTVSVRRLDALNFESIVGVIGSGKRREKRSMKWDVILPQCPIYIRISGIKRALGESKLDRVNGYGGNDIIRFNDLNERDVIYYAEIIMLICSENNEREC